MNVGCVLIPVATVVLLPLVGSVPADQPLAEPILAVVSPVYALIAVPTVTLSPVDKLVYAAIAVPNVGVDPALHAVMSSQETEEIVKLGAVPFVIVNIPFAYEAEAAVPADQPDAEPTVRAV